MHERFAVTCLWYNGGSMRYRRYSRGFALPTVVIASVVLFTILVAAVGAASSMRSSLGAQYYEVLAADAAESGTSHANSCIRADQNIATWTNVLTPATDCAGAVKAGQSQYIIETTNYRTKYSVSAPTKSADGAQIVTVTGTVELLRTSTSAVWKTYTKTVQLKAGGVVSNTDMTFGYVNEFGAGAFFSVIGADGKLRSLGYNGGGQLGNGTTNSTLTPTVFKSGSTSAVVKAFTAASEGRSLVVKMADGTAWAAGENDLGQLGTGATAITSPNPAPIILPDGGTLVSATITGTRNYYLTSKNNIYAAGECADGALGNGAGASCLDQATPVRVALPTPVTGSPNTIPTSQIVAGGSTTVYVVMAGGAVYGWGIGEFGQLGRGSGSVDDFSPRYTPVKIGTYGDTGQPKAKQVVTDGDTVYILDDTGALKGMGLNVYGQLGRGDDGTSIRIPEVFGDCLDINQGTSFTTYPIWTYACNSTNAQNFAIRTWNDSIQVAAAGVKGAWNCFDTNGGTTPGTKIILAGCLGSSTRQQFKWTPEFGQYGDKYGKFIHTPTGLCLENKDYEGLDFILNTCYNSSLHQQFVPYSAKPVAIGATVLTGTITKIVTDLWSVSLLTSTGEVWTTGFNRSGMAGVGSAEVKDYLTDPVKFPLPSGVTAVDMHQASVGNVGNLYVIGSNGKVYGAGSNLSGQLGNGTFTNSPSPVEMQVINGTTIAAKRVQTGYETTIIYTTDDSIYTVGNNSNGQLGDGTGVNKNVPIRAQYMNDMKTTIY